MNQSASEKRSTARVRVGIAVEILHKNFSGHFAESRDYSEGGILIEKLPGYEALQTGMNLDLRITGIMGEPAKMISARVLRISDDGIAMQFAEPLQALS